MKENEAAAELLRARFTSPPRGAVVGDDCPAPDRIWLAARNETPWSEIRSLLDHAAACPACTVAWRLAREQHRTEARAVPMAAIPVPRPDRRWLRYGAAAAVLFVGAGLALYRWSPKEPESPGMRATAPIAIRALVPDGGALPRQGFRLRWTPGPPGTRYSIQVTDERLATLAEAPSLERPEFLVPEAAVSRLGPDERILWQVKAVFPDGARVTSDTFLARVESSQSP